MRKRNLLASRVKGALIVTLNVLMGLLYVGMLVGPRVEAQIDDGGEGEERRPTPRPTITPTSTSTPIPTSTWTPTPTSTWTLAPTPAPTPPVVACQAYRLSTKYEGDWGRASGGFWHLSDAGSQIRSCLGARNDLGPTVDSLIAGTGMNAWLMNIYRMYGQEGLYGYQDDAAIYTLYGGLYLGDPNYLSCSKLVTTGSACAEGQVYFDSNCNRIPLASLPPNMCDAGYVLWRGSPISLNFAEQNTIAQDMTFTRFPLIPGAGDKWFTWKASGDHPLVVIDPSHSGAITSPYQLLGNWSFGGYGRDLKTTLVSGSQPDASAKPWRHGYEALATFDLNGDGAVRGDELAPLALWFDTNRDGISDKGEVKTCAEVGVTALFYRGSEYNKTLDGYALGVGFERIVKGSVESGSSFDWFSPGDTNKNRLIAYELGRQLRDRNGNEPRQIPEQFFPDAPVNRAAAINGEWAWSSDPEQNRGEPSLEGLLRFVAYSNGELRGVTISESQYLQPYPVNSMVSFTSFKGAISEDKALSFELSSDQWNLKTSANLSEDGRVLIGTTTATKSDDNRSFSYTWRATKRG